MSELGPLSDQLGRKPIIIGTVTLFIITFIFIIYPAAICDVQIPITIMVSKSARLNGLDSSILE
jgi:MFS family permease